jgi:L-lactate dehydrogenase complex protein LldG
MIDARTEILARIRDVERGPALPASRDYRRAGALPAGERVALFCRRVDEYRAEVHRVDAAGVAALIASVCRHYGARRLVVPAGVPPAWRSAELELVDDSELSAGELDGFDGVVTGCSVAIAETGTIVLTAGPSEGRRALTLIPDLHVCVVQEPQIVELLPEALALLAANGLERRPVTFVSGPSATSDIELSRVEGVHGPRNLVVLVVS